MSLMVVWLEWDLMDATWLVQFWPSLSYSGSKELVNPLLFFFFTSC